MIKTQKKSKAISLFICILTMMLFASYINLNANASAQPTPFIYSGTSIYAYSDPRPKDNYTSAYAYNTGSTCDIDAVNVYGCIMNAATIVSQVDCTAGTPMSLPLYGARYLPNYVKEYGYGFARLKFTVYSNAQKTLYGLWSPDSN